MNKIFLISIVLVFFAINCYSQANYFIGGAGAVPATPNIGLVAIGYNSQADGTTGARNTSAGAYTLMHVTTSANNTAYGWGAIGDYALNPSGSGNTAVGYQVLNRVSTGYSNTGIGDLALSYTETANNNVGIGRQAGFTIVGNKAVAVGESAGLQGFAQDYITAVGALSLYNDGFGIGGTHYNTGVGYSALYTNRTGTYNSAFGYRTLYLNYDASFCTAFGSDAAYSNSGQSYQTAFGYRALYGNANTTEHVAIGTYSLYNVNNGYSNVGVGTNALYNSSGGASNTALGTSALYNNISGNSVTAAGWNCGGSYSNSNSGTFFGMMADASANNTTSATALGYLAKAGASYNTVLGNTTVTSIGGYKNWSNISDGRFKTNVTENVIGSEFINKLRPVTYHLDMDKLNNHIYGEKRGEEYLGLEEASKEKAKKLYTGFIAQEVEEAAKSCNYNFSGVVAPANERDHYKISYETFVVPLVKAIQEQQQTLEEREATIKNRQEMLAGAKEKLKTMSAQLDMAFIELNSVKECLDTNITQPTIAK